MTLDTKKPSATEPATPAQALTHWSKTERGFAALEDLHWSDSLEGAELVDLVPNPKRYLVGKLFGKSLAMDCGEPGIHV